MTASVRKVSIVCPAYEEEEVLPSFHAGLAAVLRPLEHEYRFEIIFVDDGSQDRTLEVLRGLAAADPRVRYLSLSRNFGHQAATTAGLEHATGDAVITLDSDLQHPPALIPLLLAKWRAGFDVVLTVREPQARQGLVKRFTSWAFHQLLQRLSDKEVRVPASDYRLLSRQALDGLLRLHETHRFLRGLVNWLGYPTATVSFRVADRGGGVSKFTLRRLSAYALDALLSSSKVPLRLSLLLGLVFFLAGLGQGAFTLIAALLGRGPWDGGWGVVLTAVLLVGGCTLCCLGLVGEYVGRVYDQVKARPLYLLKETSAAPKAEAYRAGPPGASAA